MRSLSVSQRFWRATQVSAGCWPWLGRRNQYGYGQLRTGPDSRKKRGRRTVAHRVSWELHFGPIPEGLIVMHSCDNPGCVNPAHLFVGTHQDNYDDMVAKGRRARSWVMKLTDDQVRSIRKDGRKAPEIAAAHGVSDTTIYGIKSGRCKSFVPDLAEGIA